MNFVLYELRIEIKNRPPELIKDSVIPSLFFYENKAKGFPYPRFFDPDANTVTFIVHNKQALPSGLSFSKTEITFEI